MLILITRGQCYISWPNITVNGFLLSNKTFFPQYHAWERCERFLVSSWCLLIPGQSMFTLEHTVLVFTMNYTNISSTVWPSVGEQWVQYHHCSHNPTQSVWEEPGSRSHVLQANNFQTRNIFQWQLWQQLHDNIFQSEQWRYEVLTKIFLCYCRVGKWHKCRKVVMKWFNHFTRRTTKQESYDISDEKMNQNQNCY